MMAQYRNACQHDLPAHVFSMANKAYHAMIHEAKNQRFVISGESGAGKTVTANLVTKMLVYLGQAPQRNIEEKILQIHPILEAFGNARLVGQASIRQSYLRSTLMSPLNSSWTLTEESGVQNQKV